MRKVLSFTTGAIAILGAAAAAAEPEPPWMGDDDIHTAFAGVTISGVYADGMNFTESYAADGAITYRDPRKAMKGHWSVVNRTFCTLYEGAVTGGCFRVVRHSANCFEFYFQAASEADAAADIQPRPRWTARGWDRKRPATCDDKPSV